MHKVALAALLALGLAACGGGADRAAIIDACTEGGTSQAECACLADRARSELEPETYALYARAAREGAGETMGDLSPNQTLELIEFTVAAARECNEPNGAG